MKEAHITTKYNTALNQTLVGKKAAAFQNYLCAFIFLWRDLTDRVTTGVNLIFRTLLEKRNFILVNAGKLKVQLYNINIYFQSDNKLTTVLCPFLPVSMQGFMIVFALGLRSTRYSTIRSENIDVPYDRWLWQYTPYSRPATDVGNLPAYTGLSGMNAICADPPPSSIRPKLS